jgi:hypothetical protein
MATGIVLIKPNAKKRLDLKLKVKIFFPRKKMNDE